MSDTDIKHTLDTRFWKNVVISTITGA